jgi:Co/Zn/Cd efflux system component
LRVARTSLVVLGALYVLGGLSALGVFVQLRTGPAEMAALLSSSGAPPSRFLVVGLIYCAIGMTSVSAAKVLGHSSVRGVVLASVAMVLVTADVIQKGLRTRNLGFEWTDGVEAVLTCGLVLLAAVCLIQSRRQVDTSYWLAGKREL